MRIQCAFAYGAKMLGEILMLPMEKMVQELEAFFLNTLDRNGRGLRMDVDAPVPTFGTGKFDNFSLNGEFDSYYNDFLYGQWHQEHNLASDQPPSLLPPALPPQSPRNWDTSCRFQFQNRATTPPWRGADAFVLRPLLQQPQSPGGGSCNEFGRSRGTGTYIPKPVRKIINFNVLTLLIVVLYINWIGHAE